MTDRHFYPRTSSVFDASDVTWDSVTADDFLPVDYTDAMEWPETAFTAEHELAGYMAGTVDFSVEPAGGPKQDAS